MYLRHAEYFSAMDDVNVHLRRSQRERYELNSINNQGVETEKLHLLLLKRAGHASWFSKKYKEFCDSCDQGNVSHTKGILKALSSAYAKLMLLKYLLCEIHFLDHNYHITLYIS